MSLSIGQLARKVAHDEEYLFQEIFQSYWHHCPCGFYSWSWSRDHYQSLHIKSQCVVTLTVTSRFIVLYIHWSNHSKLWCSIMCNILGLLRSLRTTGKSFSVQLFQLAINNCMNLFSAQSDAWMQWGASSLTSCPEPIVFLLMYMPWCFSVISSIFSLSSLALRHLEWVCMFAYILYHI